MVNKSIISIRRSASSAPLLPNVRHARTPWQRLRGLLGRPPLADGEGLLLSPCASVHTIGMRYALDLVFIDKQGRVVKCVEGVAPYRFAAACGARHTLELAAGGLGRTGISVGDSLEWS